MVTTSDAVETLNDALISAEVERSSLAGGVRAVVPDDEVGRAFGVLRRELDSDEWESKRDPSGDNLVVNIETNDGLGELFK